MELSKKGERRSDERVRVCLCVRWSISEPLLMLRKHKPTPAFFVFAGQALNPHGSEKYGFLYVPALVVFICICACVCVCACDERLLSEGYC